jgi:hypothetical protein
LKKIFRWTRNVDFPLFQSTTISAEAEVEIVKCSNTMTAVSTES